MLHYEFALGNFEALTVHVGRPDIDDYISKVDQPSDQVDVVVGRVP